MPKAIPNHFNGTDLAYTVRRQMDSIKSRLRTHEKHVAQRKADKGNETLIASEETWIIRGILNYTGQHGVREQALTGGGRVPKRPRSL